MPSTSLYLEYGGGFQLSPQGGLKLAVDSDLAVTSTLQRIERLLYTNPGDSLFYPTYGVGLGRYVGQDIDSNLKNKLYKDILNGLTSDPGISPDPAPIITLASTVSGSLTVQIQVTTASGQTVITPAYNLTGGKS